MSAIPSCELGPWSLEHAQMAIRRLGGVVESEIRSSSDGVEVRLVAAPGRSAASLPDRVRAALFIHFGLPAHRLDVQVAPFRFPDRNGLPGGRGPGQPPLTRGRLVLIGHHLLSAAQGRASATVRIAWKDRRFEGAASGSDVAHAQMDILASATLRAVESAAWSGRDDGRDRVHLDLEGTAVVPGAERPSVLVSVHAVRGRETQTLAGAVGVADNANRAAVLATLQATDRWVRGQLRG